MLNLRNPASLGDTRHTLHEDGHTSPRLEVASDEPLPPPARAGRRGEAGRGRGQGARVHRGARQSWGEVTQVKIRAANQ